MYLPGNSSLTQYDLFNGLGRINRTYFIEVVPGSIKRIKRGDKLWKLNM